MKSPHEPSALLLTAEDAIEDGENLQQWFRQPETNKPSIPLRLHVPFSALLEILDQLEPENLRQVVYHAEKRLVSTTYTS